MDDIQWLINLDELRHNENNQLNEDRTNKGLMEWIYKGTNE